MNANADSYAHSAATHAKRAKNWSSTGNEQHAITELASAVEQLSLAVSELARQQK